jgi:SagB-type dehydrogenase family enzyme
MTQWLPAFLAGLLIVLVVLGACLALPRRPPETGSATVLPGGEVILPAPDTTGGMPVEAALQARRSVREYADQPLPLPALSQILWAAQGVTSPQGYRTAPSAGALYPLEVLVAAGDVEGLGSGVYRYRPGSHSLVLITAGDPRPALAAAALDQAAVRDAPAVLIIAAIPARTTAKYGDRGMRYVDMEAGHASQNVYLQAESLGLATVAIGAFMDEGIAAAAGLEPGEVPRSLMPVGYPA